jgi:hypothetical protein
MLLFMLCSLAGFSQQQVVSTAGSHDQSDSTTLSWTIGETVVKSFSNSNTLLTQGFHQGNLEVATFIEPSNDWEVKAEAYPNPVQNRMTVKTKNPNEIPLHIELYNMKGQLLQQKAIHSTATPLNFSQIEPGEYILQLRSKDKMIQSFKIIKN